MSTVFNHYATDVSLLCNDGLESVEAIMKSKAQGNGHGLLGDMFCSHLDTGGKRLRARLALTSAVALGQSREAALEWAAAVEVMHNATLIHDDIQDGDRLRRGKETTWVRYGKPQAINAGDLGLMLPFLLVSDIDVDGETRWVLSRLLAEHAVNTVRGQSFEMELLPNRHFDRDKYMQCVAGKTGAFFSLPVQGSALLSGISEEEAMKLGECFLPLGILFQLQDDVLDLYGNKGREMPGSDLREGKVSALVVQHLMRKPEDCFWLVSLLDEDRDVTPQSSIEKAIDTFRSSGALDDCLAEIKHLAKKVSTDKLLARYPLLQKVAQELVALALQPIGGLL